MEEMELVRVLKENHEGQDTLDWVSEHLDTYEGEVVPLEDGTYRLLDPEFEGGAALLIPDGIYTFLKEGEYARPPRAAAAEEGRKK